MEGVSRTDISGVEQFFSFDDVQSQQKVTIATLHFDDLALQRHQAYLRSRSHLSTPTWEEYIYAMSDKFDTEFDDLMSELVRLRQTDSVIGYHEAFDKAMTRLTLDPNHAISVFLNALKPELGDVVRIHRPYSLPHAYHLARFQESHLLETVEGSHENSHWPAILLC